MWQKKATSVGSAPPDGTKSTAAATPASPVVVANKTPPGQTGPKGLSPRTTYSRVNTGPTPTPTLGDQAKATPPRGLEFLPAKVAHEEISMKTQMMKTPLLNDLVKAAMEGSVQKIDISAAAAQALGYESEVEKTASEEADPESVPTEVCEKFAAALEYLSTQKIAANPASSETASPGVGPGQGASATEVLVSNRTEKNIDAGEGGQAVSKNTPPTNPGMENDPGKSSDPNNAMATNDAMQHPEQPTDPMHNATTSNAPQKQASAEKNLEVLKKIAAGNLSNLGGAAIKPGSDADNDGKKGEGSSGTMPDAVKSKLAASNLAMLRKIAEDAINPANVSGGQASAQGADAPDGVSGSEDSPEPPKPAPANTQAALVGSNQSAIDYSKRDAKSNMKSDMSNLLAEPMQSASGDKVLQKTLEHTQSSGAKIAGAHLTKTAAGHALLLKLAKEVQSEKDEKKKKKEKTSMMGGGLSTPAGQSGFNASTMS